MRRSRSRSRSTRQAFGRPAFKQQKPKGISVSIGNMAGSGQTLVIDVDAPNSHRSPSSKRDFRPPIVDPPKLFSCGEVRSPRRRVRSRSPRRKQRRASPSRYSKSAGGSSGSVPSGSCSGPSKNNLLELMHQYVDGGDITDDPLAKGWRWLFQNHIRADQKLERLELCQHEHALDYNGDSKWYFMAYCNNGDRICIHVTTKELEKPIFESDQRTKEEKESGQRYYSPVFVGVGERNVSWPTDMKQVARCFGDASAQSSMRRLVKNRFPDLDFKQVILKFFQAKREKMKEPKPRQQRQIDRVVDGGAGWDDWQGASSYFGMYFDLRLHRFTMNVAVKSEWMRFLGHDGLCEDGDSNSMDAEILLLDDLQHGMELHNQIDDELREVKSNNAAIGKKTSTEQEKLEVKLDDNVKRMMQILSNLPRDKSYLEYSLSKVPREKSFRETMKEVMRQPKPRDHSKLFTAIGNIIGNCDHPLAEKKRVNEVEENLYDINAKEFSEMPDEIFYYRCQKLFFDIFLDLLKFFSH